MNLGLLPSNNLLQHSQQSPDFGSPHCGAETLVCSCWGWWGWGCSTIFTCAPRPLHSYTPHHTQSLNDFFLTAVKLFIQESVAAWSLAAGAGECKNAIPHFIGLRPALHASFGLTSAFLSNACVILST
jgi:hypothetical protein